MKLKRQFEKLLGDGASLSAEDSSALNQAMQQMGQIYATGQVGDAERCIRLEVKVSISIFKFSSKS